MFVCLRGLKSRMGRWGQRATMGGIGEMGDGLALHSRAPQQLTKKRQPTLIETIFEAIDDHKKPMTTTSS